MSNFCLSGEVIHFCHILRQDSGPLDYPLFLSAAARTSVCSIKGQPFIIKKDSFVFSTLPAPFQDQIQHFYGKLQSF